MTRLHPSTLALLASATLAFAACAPPPAGPAAPTGASPGPGASASPAPAAAAPRTAEAASGYDKPPKEIYDVLHAPSPPSPSVSPTGDRVLLVSWEEYPSIARVAEPFLALAGVRIEPKTRRKHDTPGGYGITPCARDLTLVTVATGAETRVALPPGGCVEGVSWAVDGKRFAFRNTSSDAVELWVGDASNGATRAVAGVRLNPILGNTVQWMPDQKTLLVKLVPDGAGPPPPAPVVPPGPSIQETTGEKGEQHLRAARHAPEQDDETCSTTPPAARAGGHRHGSVTRVGKPGIYTDADAAPDGNTSSSRRSASRTVRDHVRPLHDVDVGTRPATRAGALPLADRVPVTAFHGAAPSPGARPSRRP